MSYYINLENVSIQRFREWIQEANLIPSWMVLREHIGYLSIIEKSGVDNLSDLQKNLKNKSKLHEFAASSGLPEEYLTVLGRVIRGFHPKPNRIRDFLGLSERAVRKLQEMGVKNTLQLYDHIQSPEQRRQLAAKLGIEEQEVLQLYRLTEVSRIKWVNHTFARALVAAGYDSVEKVANADPLQMYEDLKQTNELYSFYKGTIGANDMIRCVEGAQMVMDD